MPLKVLRRSVQEERQQDPEDPEAQELLEETTMHDAQADLTAGQSKYSDRGPAYEATTWSGPVMFLHLAAGAHMTHTLRCCAPTCTCPCRFCRAKTLNNMSHSVHAMLRSDLEDLVLLHFELGCAPVFRYCGAMVPFGVLMYLCLTILSKHSSRT